MKPLKNSGTLTDRITELGCKYEYEFMSDDFVKCFYSGSCKYKDEHYHGYCNRNDDDWPDPYLYREYNTIK